MMSKRINITISDNLKDYFESKSKELGIPQSSIIVMYLSEYIDLKNDFKDMLKKEM